MFTQNMNFPTFEQRNIFWSDDYAQEGGMAKKHMGIVSEQGEVVAVHSNNYKFINHKDFFTKFEEALFDNIPSIYHQNAECQFNKSDDGAKCSTVWRFPTVNYDYQTTKHRTTQSLVVSARHSVDGSWGPTAVGGMMDFFCFNLQMGGQWKLFRGRHTSGFSLDAFLEPQVDWVKHFQNMASKYQTLCNSYCSPQIAENLLANHKAKSTICCSFEENLGTEDEPVYARRLNRNGKTILNMYENEEKTRGPNKFSMASALTHWSTHVTDRKKISIDGHSNRHEFVTDFIDTLV